ADPEIDGVLAMMPGLSSPLHRNNLPTPEFMASLELDRHGKPLVFTFYGDHRDRLHQDLDQIPGVACFASVERAVHALARLRQFHRIQTRPAESFTLEAAPAAASRPRQSVLLGQEALDFLARWQIPVAPGVLTRTPEEAVAAAQGLGYPVVLKVIGPAWLHKWDAGGVLLHLMEDREVQQGFLSLMARVQGFNPQAMSEGILVQQELKGRELLLGIKQDATFGPVVLCGLGGIYTELWQDVAQTLVPVDLAQARALLARLKCYPLLTGFRGEPAVDLEAVASALVSLSRLASAYPNLKELDVNPLMATPEGCWAVDARIIWEV
ncbi:MAG: acetate--CoA ligase family protein, partial [Deltaproteobacteria bacterium]|nr:acetate--CoA ligase family protein [Deltaproteobacteria bacterium]